MKAFEDLQAKMAEKTDDSLLTMLLHSSDWTPEALDAARAELHRRNVDTRGLVPSPASATSGSPPKARSSVNRWPLYLIPWIMFAVGRVFSEQFGARKGDLDIPMFILGTVVTLVFFVPAIVATLFRHQFAIAVFLANFASCVLFGFERFVLASLAWLAILAWSLLPFIRSRRQKT